MLCIKNLKKIWYKKSIFLMLFCLTNFHAQSWFNFGFLKNAIQEHEEAYKKFAPERVGGNTIAENKLLGRQPYFDLSLNKWDYFAKASFTTIMRIFVAYTAFFMTGLASAGLYCKMN